MGVSVKTAPPAMGAPNGLKAMDDPQGTAPMSGVFHEAAPPMLGVSATLLVMDAS